MRLFTSLIATAAILFSASTAFAAANWSVSTTTSLGSPLNAVQIGETVTIDITLRTPGSVGGVTGIGGSAHGYDNNVINFVSGQAAGAVLAAICLAPPTGCLGGIANTTNPAIFLQETNPGAGNEVQFMDGVSLSAAGGDGSLDEGYNGVAGTAQFQVVFVGAAAGSTAITVGTDAAFLDGFISSIDPTVNNATVNLTVVPEPGTALLMGLGLAGLATSGRRK